MENRRKSFCSRKSWTRLNGRLVRQNLEDDIPVACQSLLTRRQLSLVDMPEECIVLILSFLEAHEICRVATLCKRLHEVSRNPVVWWNADFKFTSLMYSHIPVLVLDESEQMTAANRRRLFAAFLSKRNAIVMYLKASCGTDRDSKMLVRFLKGCNVKKLRNVNLTWTPNTWDYYLPVRQRTKGKNFQSFLQTLSERCPNLVSLKTPMDVSLKSAVTLSKLRSIQCLELRFSCRGWGEEQLSDKALGQIMSLPNLRVLKLRVTQEPVNYKLKSNSLEVFEISLSKGFCIAGLDLPRLHTFNALDVLAYNYKEEEDTCLFNAIDQGCPMIQWFNERKASAPGFCNFRLTDDEMRKFYICHCTVHAPWRIVI